MCRFSSFYFYLGIFSKKKKFENLTIYKQFLVCSQLKLIYELKNSVKKSIKDTH